MPAADRRAERRARLLDAAYDLLGRNGWQATTVRAVCAKAKLNPRYFYESFEDLDELVVAVYDRVVEELAAAVAAALEDADPDPAAQVRTAIDSTVRFVDEDRRRGRVIYVEALGNEALNRRRLEASHALVDAMGTQAANRLPDPIGRIGAAISVGGFSELLVAWLDGRIDVSRQQLVDDAAAIFVAMGQAGVDIASKRQKKR